MKTCVYCGRAYPNDITVCPACGLNLEQAPEKIMEPIEIDVEPETWIPPHQQASETVTPTSRQAPPMPDEQPPAPPQQSAAPAHTAEGLSPERMRMFRRNQYMYIFRMLLLIILALCLLQNSWMNSGNRVSDFISMSLVLVAPGLLGGLWGLLRCLARLRKTPGELAAQVSASEHGLTSLFSYHERIILKAPIVGAVLSAGALYAAYLILSNTPLLIIWKNLQLIRYIGRLDWMHLDRLMGGIAISAMLLFLVSYLLRFIRLLMLRGKVMKTP